MKIILLEKVTNLGSLGDVVTVADGYARNYLIPTKRAVRATEANLKEFEAKLAVYEEHQKQILENAQKRMAEIEGKTFAVAAKAGVDGKLFGSVTSFDIVAAVNSSGTQIKKHEVQLPNGPLKTTGEFDITVILHHDVQTVIKINVISE